jgi:hypothetical protein
MNVDVWISETKKGRSSGWSLDFRSVGGERLYVSQSVDVEPIIKSYILNRFGEAAVPVLHWPEEPSAA